MKRRAGLSLLEVPPDYGNAFHRRGGRVVPTRIGAAADMELAEIADIDRPDQRGASVRVARRCDPLLAILDIHQDGPERSYYLGAERLRWDSSIADGIRSGIDLFLVRTAGDGQEPTRVMLDAQRAVRQAWRAIRGPENDALMADTVRLVVLGWVGLAVVDSRNGWKDHGRRSRRLLDTGLERLAVYYGEMTTA